MIYVLISFILLWLLIDTVVIFKIFSNQNKLLKGVTQGNLIDILNNILKDVHLSKKEIHTLTLKVNSLSNDIVYNFQKISLFRFNPFSDTGGKQSFILALLDGKNSGILLTSLHNRGVTRWYIKEVKDGKGIDIELSEEEKQTVKKAVALSNFK
jgi:hypothetical protein